MFGGVCAIPRVLVLQARRCVATKALRPLDVLYFGTDEFSVPSLEALCSLQQTQPSVVSSVQLVSRSPKWCGRQRSQLRVPPVYAAAERLAMPWRPFECDSGDEMRQQLLPWLQGCSPGHARMLVAVSFGKLIPQEVIGAADYSLNVHPSLLPRYKGSAPIQHTLLNGDAVTGVSIQTLHPEKFDRGEVVARTPEISVESMLSEARTSATHSGGWMTRALIDTLGHQGARLLSDVLVKGTYAQPGALDTMQYESSWARTIKTTDKRVDFAQQTASQVCTRLGALGPVFAFKVVQAGKKRKSTAHLEEKRVLIHEAEETSVAGDAAAAPGTFALDEEQNVLVVKCADDTWLAVRSLQFEAFAIETPVQFASRLSKRCGSIQGKNTQFV